MDYTDFVVDREQHMRPLEYDLSEKYNGLLRYLSDMGILSNIPVGSAGPSEIVSTSDALSAPLRSLVVGGNSVQNGTPTPSAPVPINSVVNPVLHFARKNLYSGGNQTFTQSKQFTISLPAGTYTVSALVTSSDTDTRTCAIIFRYTDGDYSTLLQLGRNTRSHVTITLNKPVQLIRFYAAADNNSGSGDTATWNDIQIEAGEAETTYTPYIVPTTVTIPVTLYGLPDGTRDTLTLTYKMPSEREGWVWYNRELVRKVAETAINSVNWLYYNNNIFYVTDQILSDMRASNSFKNLFCTIYDSYQAIGSASLMPNAPDFSIAASSTTAPRIYVKDSRYNSAADFNAAATNAPLLYPLATPVTTQLDPIELPSVFGPSFTLWGTAGAVPQLTAQYVRDLSAAINDMQEAIADL